jgi:hypothetical protein
VLFGPWIRDGKKSRPGMNIPVGFSETVSRAKILKFFDADPDPGSGISLTLNPGWKNSNRGSGINKHPGSGTLRK